MDIRSLIQKLESIEKTIVNEEALTLQQVAAIERAAADKAKADKAQGGWKAFTTWDPKTAGHIALSKLADQHGLPGLFNSQGEYVVAASKRMDGETGEKPQIAPPTPADWEPLKRLGLVPGSAGGPAGLTNLLTGGGAQKEFDQVKSDSARTAAGLSSDRFIKAKLLQLRDLVKKLKATLEKPYDFSTKDIKTENLARELIESFGYLFEADAGAGRGLQGGPTAAQMAQAPAPSAKSPAADKPQIKLDPETKRYVIELPTGQKVTQGRGFPTQQAAMDFLKANPHLATPSSSGTSPKHQKAVDAVSQVAGMTDAEKEAAKALAKKGIAGRMVPYAGAGLDFWDAYERWQDGDRSGAVIAALGGAGGMLPYVGLPISMGAFAANQKRDFDAGRPNVYSAVKDILPENSVMSFKNKLEAIELQDKIVSENANGYFFDWDKNLYRNDGTLVPDDEAIKLWETVQGKPIIHLDESAFEKIMKYGGDALGGIKNFFKGLASKEPDVVKNADPWDATPAQRAGAAVSDAARKNPKTATAAGVATGVGTAHVAGDKKTDSTGKTDKTDNGGKSSDTGSANSGDSGQAAQPADSSSSANSGSAGGQADSVYQGADTKGSGNAAGDNKPAAASITPEQQNLAKEIEAVMGELADIEDETVYAALQDARSTLDQLNKPVAQSFPVKDQPKITSTDVPPATRDNKPTTDNKPTAADFQKTDKDTTPVAAPDKEYQIVPGDNLTKIAKKFNTSIDAIMKANPYIKDPNLIYAGKSLKIPT